MAFGAKAATFPDPLGVGHRASMRLTVFSEVFCALSLVLGLATRLATIPLLITMGVAAFVINAGAPWDDKELRASVRAPLPGPARSGAGAILARQQDRGEGEAVRNLLVTP